MNKPPAKELTLNFSSSAQETLEGDSDPRPLKYVQLVLFDSTAYAKDSQSASASGEEQPLKRGETCDE